ncbi:MAG: DUF669 domain-containing protein [Clostridia bacterium]|nr:DUF669 domain-containing protein [Clostridia bacterium]
MAQSDNINAQQDRELGWDDIIENDGASFEVLPEGDYDFEVVSFERGRYTPSRPDSKLPPCPMALLTIEIGSDQSKARIQHRLFLHSRCEGLLCAFFTAIGQRKRGEALNMNWNRVTGATGRCKVTVREYTTDKGEKRQSNQISRFYEPDDAPAAPGGWTPGKF